MHIFLLSLPDSRQRRLSAIGKLQRHKIPFEIVDGVEARKWHPNFLNCEESVRSWMKPTEVGCYMGHLRAMQRLVDYRLPYACILEDDFCFEADPDWGLMEIADHLPEDFHYIHLQRDLGTNLKYRDGPVSNGFARMIETPYLATGVIICYQLAAYILEHEACCRMPIDHLYAKLSHRGNFYRPIKPLIGIQSDLASDTHRVVVGF